MNLKRIGYVFMIILCSVAIQFNTGCKGVGGGEVAYDTKLDSVHMGVKLGMTRQEFFDHCWDLNKSGQNITQGHHNTSVLHTDSTNFKYSTDINFYPEFNKDGVAYILPLRFEYRPWAPWNKETYAEHLLPEVLEYMENAYGGPFQEKTLEDGQKIFFKYDSPRLITIYHEDNHYVHVKFKNENFK